MHKSESGEGFRVGTHSPLQDQNAKRVTAYCVCSTIDLKQLQKKLAASQQVFVKRWDESLYLAPSMEDDNDYVSPNVQSFRFPDKKEVFIMEFGVLVLWGYSAEEEEDFLQLPVIEEFQLQPLSDEDVQTEIFKFMVDAQRVTARIVHDVIILRDGNDTMTKLALSMAIAQSVKLSRFEDMVDASVQNVESMPAEVAKTGRVQMTRQESIRTIGRLFNMRTQVNLIAPILDTPEIFWTEPHLLPVYDMLRLYLEISNRVKILNLRVRVMGDMLDMLDNYLNKTHVESLEWIVIGLIALSVTLAALTIFVKIKHYMNNEHVSAPSSFVPL